MATTRSAEILINQALAIEDEAARDAGAKVKTCVQPGVSFPIPPRGNTNPAAQFRVDLRPDGVVASVKLTRSSGNQNFDSAVETGIRRCSPFPSLPSGKYPSWMDINYNMYD